MPASPITFSARRITRLLMLTLLGGFSVGVPLTLFEPAPVQAQANNQIVPTTPSNPSKIALARHLSQIGARMYGSFKCPHCQNQKELFGREAAAQIPYVECHPDGANAQTQACIDAKIRVVPTWEINGERYEGTLSLEQLADLSKYPGQRQF